MGNSQHDAAFWPPAGVAGRPRVTSLRFLNAGPHSLDDPMLVALQQDVSLTRDDSGRPGWAPVSGRVGRLRTAPVMFVAGEGSRLMLDADARAGEVRVQLRDDVGHIVPGFSFSGPSLSPQPRAGGEVKPGGKGAR